MKSDDIVFELDCWFRKHINDTIPNYDNLLDLQGEIYLDQNTLKFIHAKLRYLVYKD